MTDLGRAAVFALLVLAGLALPLAAQDVALTSRDGRVEITGTLLGFDGEFYRVSTEYGELTVDGAGVQCDGPGCPNLLNFVAETRFSGAAQMGSVLMPALIEAFAQKSGYQSQREDLDSTRFVYTLSSGDQDTALGRFEFRATNTNEGFADLLADEADIVMALREIRPHERSRAREIGLGDMTGTNRSRVIALDALVPLVSLANPVRGISPQMLADIFAGNVTNWKFLGGPDAPIYLHLPDLASGFEQAIEDKVMAPANAQFVPKVERHSTIAGVSEAVIADSLALGIGSFAARRNAQALTLSGSCGFALDASRRTIKTEDYPLTAPMFLYFPARRLPLIAREFLAFTRGSAAQIVIRRTGFVDQTPEKIPVEEQGNRFANAISVAGGETKLEELQRMTTTLVPLARLTTSFRFEAGSARLDAHSRSNVQQLARALEVGRYDARRLLFVGFSDGIGAAGTNREIALRRAEAVRRAVSDAAVTANLDRVDLDVDAFGEAMPIACDDSSWGRQANRRVEVWVR